MYANFLKDFFVKINSLGMQGQL